MQTSNFEEIFRLGHFQACIEGIVKHLPIEDFQRHNENLSNLIPSQEKMSTKYIGNLNACSRALASYYIYLLWVLFDVMRDLEQPSCLLKSKYGYDIKIYTQNACKYIVEIFNNLVGLLDIFGIPKPELESSGFKFVLGRKKKYELMFNEIECHSQKTKFTEMFGSKDYQSNDIFNSVSELSRLANSLESEFEIDRAGWHISNLWFKLLISAFYCAYMQQKYFPLPDKIGSLVGNFFDSPTETGLEKIEYFKLMLNLH